MQITGHHLFVGVVLTVAAFAAAPLTAAEAPRDASTADPQTLLDGDATELEDEDDGCCCYVCDAAGCKYINARKDLCGTIGKCAEESNCQKK